MSGAFQFNHIRYHREYDALLCLADCPCGVDISRMDQGRCSNRQVRQVSLNGERRHRFAQINEKVKITFGHT